MDIHSSLGCCGTCGKALISVNDIKKCLRCEANKNISSVVQPAEILNDPGEDEITRVLAQRGVICQSTPSGAAKSLKNDTKSTSLPEILGFMRSLPMPDDIKQFKQIKKIITLLEKVVNKE